MRPATAATMLKHFGIDVSEEEAARNVFLSRHGTEVWHIARYLKRKGLKATVVGTSHRPSQLPTPCVAGVSLVDKDGINHVLVIFDETPTSFIIGDPLGGRFEWTKQKTYDNYYFKGWVISVRKGI